MIDTKNLKMKSGGTSLHPEKKAALVAALRSGKYQQGKSALCIIDAETDDKHYCCLGVGADISPFESSTDYEEDGSATVLKWDDDTGSWGPYLQEWFGSKTDNPVFFRHITRAEVEWFETHVDTPTRFDSESGTNISATFCNDQLSLTFDQIADLFEFWC